MDNFNQSPEQTLAAQASPFCCTAYDPAHDGFYEDPTCCDRQYQVNRQIDTLWLAQVQRDYLKATRRIARFETLTDMIDWNAMTIAQCRYLDMMKEKLETEAFWLADELDYLTTPDDDWIWPGL